jgi:hypothetical protein
MMTMMMVVAVVVMIKLKLLGSLYSNNPEAQGAKKRFREGYLRSSKCMQFNHKLK